MGNPRRQASLLEPMEQSNQSLSEIHAVAGMDVAELLSEIDHLEKDHEDFSFGRSLLATVEIAPTIPVGKSMTNSTRTTPSRSCQYSVVATA